MSKVQELLLGLRHNEAIILVINIEIMKKVACEDLVLFFPSPSEHEELSSTYIANCIFNSLLSFTATVLNILTVYAIIKTSAIPKSLKTLLANLAISDICVGLVSHPIYVSFLAKWLQGNDSTCVSYTALLNISGLFSNASFFGVLAVGLDRFLAIYFHLRYQELVTHRRVIGGLIVVWVLSAVMSTVWFLHEGTTVICSALYVICFLITAVLYGRIYLVLQRHKNQIVAMQVVQETQDCSEIANMARVRKSAICTFYGYLAFSMSSVPFIIFLVVVKVHGPGTVLKGYSLYAATLIFLNSSLNPVIYCWKMRCIQRTVMVTLRKLSRCVNRPPH